MTVIDYFYNMCYYREMNRREQTLATLMTPEIAPRVQEVREQWQDISYDQVLAATEATPQVGGVLENTSRAYVIEPDNTYVDETRTLVLSLPYVNGWKPHHFIRAKTMQQIIAPDSRLLVFPNNSHKESYYDLNSMTDIERDQLAQGNLNPLADMHLRTLEHLDKTMNLGALGLSGYSFGGRVALSIADRAQKSDMNVSHINSDEMPTEIYRTAEKLSKDFRKSGGLGEFRKAVKEAEIPALRSALRFDRMARELIGFVRASGTEDGKLMQEAMSGHYTNFLRLEYLDGVSVKVGYVKGSRLVDPNSVFPGVFDKSHQMSLVQYSGPGFHGHPTGDNVINHALMANDGLNPSHS